MKHQTPNAAQRRAAEKNKGFTLIEVLVVMAILALIFGMVAPQLFGKKDDADRNKTKLDIAALDNALQIYRLDNYNYPSTEQTLQALVSKPNGYPEPKNYSSGGYIQKLPKDPWGNDYVFQSPGEHGEYDIISYGADGRPGGEGNNADINSWEQ